MEDWIVDVVRQLGVVGIGLLMFVEHLFPPLPSELIMPLAGYLAARGQLSFWPAVLAGTLGSLAGASVWYWVGRRATPARLRAWVGEHGVWLALTPGDVDQASDWFRARGRFGVLLGRLMPLVRTLISAPAGFSRMPFPLFLALSAVGTGLWTGALAYAGRVLGERFQQVEAYIGPVSWVIIAVAVATYLRRAVRLRRLRRRGNAGPGQGTRARGD